MKDRRPYPVKILFPKVQDSTEMGYLAVSEEDASLRDFTLKRATVEVLKVGFDTLNMLIPETSWILVSAMAYLVVLARLLSIAVIWGEVRVKLVGFFATIRSEACTFMV